jgi:hypothetical protein
VREANHHLGRLGRRVDRGVYIRRMEGLRGRLPRPA